jgi:hypothetical protein
MSEILIKLTVHDLKILIIDLNIDKNVKTSLSTIKF